MATGIIAALTLAPPLAEASAAGPTPVSVALPPYTTVPAFLVPLLSSLDPSTEVTMATAGAAIDDVFNGGTTVIVSTGPAVGGTTGSP